MPRLSAWAPSHKPGAQVDRKRRRDVPLGPHPHIRFPTGHIGDEKTCVHGPHPNVGCRGVRLTMLQGPSGHQVSTWKPKRTSGRMPKLRPGPQRKIGTGAHLKEPRRCRQRMMKDEKPATSLKRAGQRGRSQARRADRPGETRLRAGVHRGVQMRGETLDNVLVFAESAREDIGSTGYLPHQGRHASHHRLDDSRRDILARLAPTHQTDDLRLSEHGAHARDLDWLAPARQMRELRLRNTQAVRHDLEKTVPCRRRTYRSSRTSPPCRRAA